MRKIYCIGITLLVLFSSSCASKKDVLYFQDIETYQSQLDTSKNTIRIKNNDILSIFVSAPDEKSVLAFNAVNGLSKSNSAINSNAKYEPEYLVDEEGQITFPILGKINVINKTKREVINLLEEKLINYIKEPSVSIRIANFKISVLGEVDKPGLFEIKGNKVTILEALSLAGDMTINGQRNDVLLVREEKGIKSFNKIDFTESAIFSSPYYYLQQNDVVVVSPNNSKVQQSKNTIRNISSLSGILSLFVSIAAILTR